MIFQRLLNTKLCLRMTIGKPKKVHKVESQTVFGVIISSPQLLSQNVSLYYMVT